MSLNEELTDSQVQELRSRLLALRDSLVSLLASNKEETKPVGVDQPIGRLTRIDAIQQQKMALASRGMQQDRLRLIEAALKSCEEGEFGICRLCGGDVGWKRLDARPETPFCLDCQQDRESVDRP